MRSNEMIAMLLAGGKGTRLRELTENMAKPALHFGGKYRLIDFPLSNCVSAGIDTVGVLTQYEPLELNCYIGKGRPWHLDKRDGGAYVLPPYVNSNGNNCWYKGTADAISQNISFIERADPEYVLILSGDHIYNMDYSRMLDEHKKKEADLTISVKPVPWQEAYRFGIMNTDKDRRIIDFEEKPRDARSNLASMGVYIFKWDVLKKYLLAKEDRTVDFGKDIIPLMLRQGKRIYAYCFNKYWKDVGTVRSYWEANMDLISDNSGFDLREMDLYTRSPELGVQCFNSNSRVESSIIGEGSIIRGDIMKSIIFYNVEIGKNSTIKNSVILPGAKIGSNVHINNSVIGSNTLIEDGNYIGFPGQGEGITLIGNNKTIERKVEMTAAR